MCHTRILWLISWNLQEYLSIQVIQRDQSLISVVQFVRTEKHPKICSIRNIHLTLKGNRWLYFMLTEPFSVYLFDYFKRILFFISVNLASPYTWTCRNVIQNGHRARNGNNFIYFKSKLAAIGFMCPGCFVGLK